METIHNLWVDVTQRKNHMSQSTILFAEDDHVLNMATCGDLEEHGMLVDPVYSGVAAIAAIDRLEDISALLTDVDLGAGPDGFDVARHARALHPALPVVYVSGTMAAQHAAEGVAGSLFVAKPFHPRQITDALDQVMGRRAA
jgi:CheY-like chemotaxis protein